VEARRIVKPSNILDSQGDNNSSYSNFFWAIARCSRIKTMIPRTKATLKTAP
jgi:hypothetical protein